MNIFQKQLDLKTEKYKKETSAKIRTKVLELGKEADRILISDIIKATDVNDEILIIQVINDMIKKEEIFAEFFTSSKSILFNVEGKTVKIDKLLDTYKEWEKGKLGKKENNEF